jgi:hypothetical protein
MMPITYTNRMGKSYALRQSTTKKGNTRYYFSTKESGDPVETMPEGYEIYEHPNGQVFLRREQPQVITDEELEIVRRGIEREAAVDHYILDVKDKAIIVYTADQAPDSMVDTFRGLGVSSNLRETLASTLSYTAMMRFTLEDEEKRAFLAERYCFRGRIDDWIPLDAPAPLAQQVEQFVYHLGRDSFYELHLGF